MMGRLFIALVVAAAATGPALAFWHGVSGGTGVVHPTYFILGF